MKLIINSHELNTAGHTFTYFDLFVEDDEGVYHELDTILLEGALYGELQDFIDRAKRIAKVMYVTEVENLHLLAEALRASRGR